MKKGILAQGGNVYIPESKINAVVKTQYTVYAVVTDNYKPDIVDISEKVEDNEMRRIVIGAFYEKLLQWIEQGIDPVFEADEVLGGIIETLYINMGRK